MQSEVIKKRRRSGSDTRQKYMRVTVRFTPEEYTELRSNAEAVGQENAPYMREQSLRTPKARKPRRHITVEVQALTRTLGQLNKIGGNIHQLLKQVNFRYMALTEADYRDALTGYKQAVAAVMAALGRTSP